MQQVIRVLQQLKLKKTDFIFIQDFGDYHMKEALNKALRDVDFGYYWPDIFFSGNNNYSTLILSRYPVRFGCLQYNFEIPGAAS